MKEFESISLINACFHAVPPSTFIVILLFCATCVFLPVHSAKEGFILEDIRVADRPETLECPSSNVITTRYKCHMNGQWVDCFRKHCCLGFTLIAGQCIPDDQDPCSLGLCEQKCSTFFGRVVCTCFHGYKFDPDRRKLGLKPYCIDTNECSEDNGGCEHECSNTEGGFQCSCKTGYTLKTDNVTCQVFDDNGMQVSNLNTSVELLNSEDQCYSSCTVVSRLQDRVRVLEEKIQALSTAIQIYSFGAGPPGPEGPQGPPGPTGPRGFPGQQGSPGRTQVVAMPNSSRNRTTRTKTRQNGDSRFDYDDYEEGEEEPPDGDETILPVPGNGDQKNCQCKRGPIGPPGAPGSSGQRGEKGEDGMKGDKGDEGALDFLLLMIADIRWDIKKLQQKVFLDNQPTEYRLPNEVGNSNPSLDSNTETKNQTSSVGAESGSPEV